MHRVPAVSDDTVRRYRLKWLARFALAVGRLDLGRRDRPVVAWLSDHELRDIGLCRDDASRIVAGYGIRPGQP